MQLARLERNETGRAADCGSIGCRAPWSSTPGNGPAPCNGPWTRQQGRLERLDVRLRSLRPRRTLEQGYAWLSAVDGEPLTPGGRDQPRGKPYAPPLPMGWLN